MQVCEGGERGGRWPGDGTWQRRETEADLPGGRNGKEKGGEMSGGY